MKNAAFQASFTQHDDDFFTALFAIVIHTAGVNLAPFPMPVLRGRIGQGELAFDVFRGLQRGAEIKVARKISAFRHWSPTRTRIAESPAKQR